MERTERPDTARHSREPPIGTPEWYAWAQRRRRRGRWAGRVFRLLLLAGFCAFAYYQPGLLIVGPFVLVPIVLIGMVLVKVASWLWRG